jgi:cytochrome c-type biogenesis protein CcmE
MKRLPALIVVMWAAALIAALQLYALSQGVDGTLFSVSVAAIAALAAGFAGFKIKG